ncbi:hypothetical protein CcaCcLH18_07861 [Colletotrichum camelliae]|nr:hypothetical protein CcaCcLH18_07861 [Colletotrichum camelliae]
MASTYKVNISPLVMIKRKGLWPFNKQPTSSPLDHIAKVPSLGRKHFYARQFAIGLGFGKSFLDDQAAKSLELQLTNWYATESNTFPHMNTSEDAPGEFSRIAATAVDGISTATCDGQKEGDDD